LIDSCNNGEMENDDKMEKKDKERKRKRKRQDNGLKRSLAISFKKRNEKIT